MPKLQEKIAPYTQNIHNKHLLVLLYLLLQACKVLVLAIHLNTNIVLAVNIWWIPSACDIVSCP